MTQNSNETSLGPASRDAGHLKEGSSGDDDHMTTASLQSIDTGNENEASPQPNVAIILAVVILVAVVFLVMIFAYRRYKYLKKRRNSPYHVPIIEYREEPPSISAHSSGGYGTYRDLEEIPINEDFSSKIEGKLTLQDIQSTA